MHTGSAAFAALHFCSDNIEIIQEKHLYLRRKPCIIMPSCARSGTE